MRLMLHYIKRHIGTVGLIIFQMPGLLPLMLVILVCAGLLIYGNMKLGYPWFDRMQKKLDGLNRTSREFLSAIRIVKAFRAEEQEREKFEDISFIIAHRLSTIRDSDLILLIRDGRIAEQGTHEQLMSLAGEYAQLYLTQMGEV